MNLWQYRKIGMLLMILAAGAARAALPEQEFIWQQANAQAAAAANSNDWRRAALTYRQLADAGARNGGSVSDRNSMAPSLSETQRTR